MGKPLILIDVDGVLNPYDAKPSRRPEGYTTHRLRPKGFEHTRNPLRVWLAPEHGPLLLKLAKQYDVELVWCTTWEHEANTMIGPVLGLPDLPVIEFGDYPGALRGWKFPAVLSYAAQRPLVWLDDDFHRIARRGHLDDFLKARAELPTLLHHVDSRIGMTMLDIDAVCRWLASIDRTDV